MAQPSRGEQLAALQGAKGHSEPKPIDHRIRLERCRDSGINWQGFQRIINGIAMAYGDTSLPDIYEVLNSRDASLRQRAGIASASDLRIGDIVLKIDGEEARNSVVATVLFGKAGTSDRWPPATSCPERRCTLTPAHEIARTHPSMNPTNKPHMCACASARTSPQPDAVY